MLSKLSNPLIVATLAALLTCLYLFLNHKYIETNKEAPTTTDYLKNGIGVWVLVYGSCYVVTKKSVEQKGGGNNDVIHTGNPVF